MSKDERKCQFPVMRNGNFGKYKKFHVHNMTDEYYLNDSERQMLHTLLNKIREGRLSNMKKENSYVVVNEDEPYADKVWGLIKESYRGKV